MFINFYRRRLPRGPGTGNYAYVPGTERDPVQTVITGPGFVIMKQLSSRQPPQVYAPHTVTIAGLGGLTAGQIAQQPLIVTNGT